jgi:hypothetical protein
MHMNVLTSISGYVFARASACGLAAAFALLLSPAPARADATCTSLIAQKAAALDGLSASFDIDVTMHREGVDLVTYSRGGVREGGGGWIHGYANQLFSDRMNQTQPFDASAPDALEIWISPYGELYLYYQPWNFWTTWDMSCGGEFMTRYVPGHGVVTLAFRALVRDIQ